MARISVGVSLFQFALCDEVLSDTAGTTSFRVVLFQFALCDEVLSDAESQLSEVVCFGVSIRPLR